MNRLKIGYFADGPWSHETLKLLLNDSEIDIAFIVPRVDTSDEVLKSMAIDNNIDLLNGVRVNSNEFYDLASAYNCDLFVSMSFNQIFRDRIINLPQCKTINCHAGKLPFYRGRNILNWALINDEKEFGITVHYVDEGIDTGNIILQRVYEICDEDNYKTLLEKAHYECADILYAAIEQIKNGEAKSIDQSTIHPVGFYCGMRGIGDEIINWNQDSRELFCFIRAICSPGPKATTYMDGKIVKINNSRMIDRAPSYKGTVGQIIGKTEEGFLVKTKDNFIEILEIESEIKLKIGYKLS